MYNHLLTTFLCVADCGSLNKAAEQLFLSATAVMKQINQLERQWNLTLFRRTNRGIQLTPSGASLYKDAKRIIADSERALERARALESEPVQVLRVGTSMLNPCKTFMDLWYQMSDRLPQYKIQIVPFEDTHTGILSVIEHIGTTFDFIVGVCDSEQWLQRCQFYPLGRYRKCVAVPMGHPLALRKRLTLEDLHGETLMMVRQGDSGVNDRIRADLRRYHPEIHLEDTEHYYDIQVFNRCEQEGHLLLNISCWQDIHPSLVTLPVDWDYEIPYGLLYPLHPSERVTAFLGQLEQYLEEQRGVASANEAH